MLHVKNDINAIKSPQKAGYIENMQPSDRPDPQVKLKKTYPLRRSFSASCKLRILEDFDACKSALARGIFLRKEGLYYSTISNWKKALMIEQL
jgi:hypothetical protein